MNVAIRSQPAFAHLAVDLKPGDSITAESGAMVSRDSCIQMKTSFSGGFCGAVLRRLFGGESLFVNTFSATNEPGQVVLTQAFPGDLAAIELKETTVYLQPGAYVAAESGVKLGLGYAGLVSWIGREGLFRLKASGTGRVWIGAYGGIVVKDVQEEFIVDTGHLVAYEPSCGLKLGLPGGIISSFMGGEGLITRIKGPGRVWLQTRNFDGLVAWANSYL